MSVPLFNLAIERPPDISDRNHRTFLRKALEAAALNHLLTKTQKHFELNRETRIGGEYGITPRQKKYQLRKARKQGHQRPNVYTGRERLHILANSRIAKTFRKARVVYRAIHSRSTEQGERWIREMEAISQDEAREASQLAHNTYHTQAEDFRSQRQRIRTS